MKGKGKQATTYIIAMMENSKNNMVEGFHRPLGKKDERNVCTCAKERRGMFYDSGEER